MKKQIALGLAGLLLLASLAGCASSGSYSQSASSAADYPAAEAAPNPSTSGYDGEYLRDNSINIQGEVRAEGDWSTTPRRSPTTAITTKPK